MHSLFQVVTITGAVCLHVTHPLSTLHSLAIVILPPFSRQGGGASICIKQRMAGMQGLMTTCAQALTHSFERDTAERRGAYQHEHDIQYIN